MKRLTEKYDVITSVDKDGNEIHSKGIRVENRDLADKKLFEIENIEEELDIDFITLYKALTNGVWIKDEVGQIHHTNVYLHNLILSSSSNKNHFCFITPNNELLLFNKIKQDWALIKEDLL